MTENSLKSPSKSVDGDVKYSPLRIEVNNCKTPNSVKSPKKSVDSAVKYSPLRIEINNCKTPNSRISPKSPYFSPSTALQNKNSHRINPQKWRKLFRGYIRQDWNTVSIDDGIDELRAEWAELFFDLIFVACIVHLGQEAVYSISHQISRKMVPNTIIYHISDIG